MSDTFLRIIPTSPSYIPNKIRQSKAQHLLEELFGKQEVEVQTTEEVEFIDQGQNFKTIYCNSCGQKIELEVWQNIMNVAYETKFENLIFHPPCCSVETSL